MSKSLMDYCDTLSESIIRWQRELTARPALGPTNDGEGEKEKADWLLGELKAMGFTDITELPCPDDRVPCGFRPNICARVSGKSAKTVWVISHLDVVPPGDESLWNTPPYELTVEGDFVTGRGVEDNQQAIVMGLAAAKALLDNKATPDLSLGLLFVADEETGMVKGLPHVLETAPELISKNDLVLVPDMGSDDGTLMEIAEKGLLWLRFEVLGVQCHASTPDKGKNSLVAASALILALDELRRIFPSSDPIFEPPVSTFEPTKKEANVENVNTIPGRDVFYLDCRVLPEYSLDAVIAQARNISDRVAAEYGVTVNIKPVSRDDAPAPTPADAPVVQKLQKVLEAQRGIKGNLVGVGGLTVANCLRAKDIPAVAWSTIISNAHIPNEQSRISYVILDAKTVLGMLEEN